MLTLLAYAVGAVVVVAVLYALGVYLLPKGEQIAPAYPDARPWYLETGRRLTSEDVTNVRLPVALRGYRFSETDILLDRLAEELAARDAEIAELKARHETPVFSFAKDNSPDVAVGFGYKTAWLAFRGVSQERAAAAVGLTSYEPADWSTAIPATFTDDEAVAVTPPVRGADGDWVLVTGTVLMEAEPDIAALSRELGTEVQYFVSQRIVEAHGWARAINGEVVRAFQWIGDRGELGKWVGRPDATEREFGLPDVERIEDVGDEFDAHVDEDAVMQLAGRWSLDPTRFDETPSPGKVLLGKLP